jgi:hypothetical protein
MYTYTHIYTHKHPYIIFQARNLMWLSFYVMFIHILEHARILLSISIFPTQLCSPTTGTIYLFLYASANNNNNIDKFLENFLFAYTTPTMCGVRRYIERGQDWKGLIRKTTENFCLCKKIIILIIKLLFLCELTFSMFVWVCVCFLSKYFFVCLFVCLPNQLQPWWHYRRCWTEGVKFWFVL